MNVMNRKTKDRLAGFTLIELVVVIALLGILAAFAIPRFASLEREARIATTQGLAGSVRGAAALAHSLWIAQGVTPVAMEGVAINLTNGYPDASDVALTLADTSGYNVTVNGGGDQATFSRVGAPNPATCVVVYEDAVVNFSPNITTDLSGC
ncbi:type II secretion system protein [Woeseia oceani]|nr:type II secretion system protein [Woeseia oceani]